jgi:hypothetical protein
MAFWQKQPKTESGPYRHHLAPFAVVNGGAMEFAFERPSTLPLFSFRGDARVAGEFKVFGAGAPIIELHPIGAPQGQPFINGMYHIQETEEISNSGAISLQEVPPG